MVVINANTGISAIQDGTVNSAKIVDSAIQPVDMAQKLTLMTAQTATGTSIDFTGIPSWAKRITVMLNGVSTNGSSAVQIQIGSGSVQNSGYLGAVLHLDATANSNSSSMSGGFKVESATSSTVVRSGNAYITNISTNTYIYDCKLGRTDLTGLHLISSGSVTLSGTLDRVRITTVNGTDTFDAGTINVLYEG